MIWKTIKKILGIKDKEVPDYPYEFALIEYSPIALKNNILDDQNKVIYHYVGGKVKKHRYSEARIKAMEIPFVDKTKKESRFPVFGKILPSEVEYR